MTESSSLTEDNPTSEIVVGGPGRFREILSLFVESLGRAFDVGLLVLATVLLSLALVVLLDGFGVLEIALTENTGAMLGSGLVIAVFGAFALGVAVEGPGGNTRGGVAAFREVITWIVGIVSVAIVGAVLVLVAGYLRRFVEDLPQPFDVAVKAIRAVGLSGLTVGLFLGIPAVWGAYELWGSDRWVKEIELPISFAVWAAGAAIFLLSAL